MGGVEGLLSRRLWKDSTEAAMESQREGGRSEEAVEEGLMEWIRVLREGLEDLRGSVVARERNSCGEDCRDERSLFSIAISGLSFEI